MEQVDQQKHGRDGANEQPAKSRVWVITIVLVILALVLGIAGGALAAPRLSRLLPQQSNTESLTGKTTVTEDELDSVMGTYTYEGERKDVTVREAILESSTLDAARNSDGTYDVPSVDSVLSIARNYVLSQDAEKRELTVNEDDAKAYARETLGTDDYTQIAAGYGMSVDQVGELMMRSALLGKLRDQVVTTAAVPEPAAPATVEAGKEDEPMPQYATYVVGLLGDEWDANANSWARTDGPYRAQLKDYTISNEAATYAAAQAAYFVAYSQYSQVQQQISSEWTAYVNTLLADVPVELTTLVA